ncbi:MAG: aldo/keto reductase [Myxococcota bacterium]
MPNEEPIPGRATPEATAARLANSSVTDGWIRAMGDTGLSVSAVGFGCYRVREDDPEHVEALRAALVDGGVNLIDTSWNYEQGASERAVGGVLRALISGGVLAREDVVVVSKVGYLQGALLDELKLEEEIDPLPGRIARVAHDHWHSVSPAYISRCLEMSLARLGLEALDVLLLHNPEYLIDPGPPEAANSPLFARVEAFYEALVDSFRALEAAVEEGKIGCYGVSSNALVASVNEDRRTSLERILEAAREAGGERHHLKVIQLPLNAIEQAAVQASTLDDAIVERCAQEGLAVLANRPMNAIVAGHVVRLADPGPDDEASQFAAARKAVARLEAVVGAHEAGHPLPTWSKELPGSMRKLFNAVAFDDFQLNFADRKTEGALATLANQVKGDAKGSALMGRWIRDYVAAYALLMRAARAQFARRDRQRLAPRVEEIRAALPNDLQSGSVSQQAVAWSATRPGVTATLVGMRRPPYVTDVTALRTCVLSAGDR